MFLGGQASLPDSCISFAQNHKYVYHIVHPLANPSRYHDDNSILSSIIAGEAIVISDIDLIKHMFLIIKFTPLKPLNLYKELTHSHTQI